MQIRSFVVSFREIPIDSRIVKSGRIGPDAVTACRLVSVGLFVSRDLRRDVEVSITRGEPRDLRLVTFCGTTLKRVSPDERSISFFLAKAVAAADKLQDDNDVTMDNGMIVRRCPLVEFVKDWSDRPVFLASKRVSHSHVKTPPDPNGVFIYDYAETLTPAVEEHSPWPWPMSRTPERFVLEVNRQFDLQRDEASEKAS